MLNSKTLTKLIIITAICAIPVVIIAIKGGETIVNNLHAAFLPDLIKQKDEVTQVIIQDSTSITTLNKENGAWLSHEHGDYPVVTSKVEELIYSLADLRIIEPKTSKKEYFAQLDVNDVTDPESSGILISLKNASGADLVKLIIGKREGMRIGEEYQEHIIVRRDGEEQTWLVQGILPLSNEFKDWVEQPLLGVVDTDQIKTVAIKSKIGTSVVISKNKQEAEDFILETAKTKKGMILDLDSVNTMPFEVAELEFNDVLPAANTNVDWNNSLTAVLETFPGVKIILNVVKQDEKILAKVQAETGAEADVALIQKVQEYNLAKQGWVYELPKEFYKHITLENEDFLKPEE